MFNCFSNKTISTYMYILSNGVPSITDNAKKKYLCSFKIKIRKCIKEMFY